MSKLQFDISKGTEYSPHFFKMDVAPIAMVGLIMPMVDNERDARHLAVQHLLAQLKPIVDELEEEYHEFRGETDEQADVCNQVSAYRL
mgnify:CR=1 FL=1